MTEPHHSPSDADVDSGQLNHATWRKEVHSHVARFRTRNGRRLEGAFSMRFPFPPNEEVTETAKVSFTPPSPQVSVPADAFAVATAADSGPEIEVAGNPHGSASEPVTANGSDVTGTSGESEKATETIPESSTVAVEEWVGAAPPPLNEPDAEPAAAIRPRPRPRRKVIAFPRVSETAETTHPLAEPVSAEQPRILEVPEELEAYPATPFLEGLQFEPSAQISAAPADHAELPLQAASIPRRMSAAVVDCALVLIAAVLTAFIVHKMIPDLAFTKPARLIAALVLLLLWAIFQYLHLVYAGRTAGMQLAGLRLRTFNGRQPTLRHLRNRALGLYLATASLAMGLLWAFVDADTLCWHDRISGTYLTRRE